MVCDCEDNNAVGLGPIDEGKWKANYENTSGYWNDSASRIGEMQEHERPPLPPLR